MGLRAPRLALLVPGWGDWHFMARNGIHAITQMWGGAGWLVVPVVSADVNPALLAALREYDPDYVAIPAAANSFVTRRDMAPLGGGNADPRNRGTAWGGPIHAVSSCTPRECEPLN